MATGRVIRPLKGTDEFVGNTAGLLWLMAHGHEIHVAIGPDKIVAHDPRSRYDPQPFTDGFFRYKSSELYAKPAEGSKKNAR